MVDQERATKGAIAPSPQTRKTKNNFHKTSQKYINKTHTTKLILKINIVVNITHSKRINGDCGQKNYSNTPTKLGTVLGQLYL